MGKLIPLVFEELRHSQAKISFFGEPTAACKLNR